MKKVDWFAQRELLALLFHEAGHCVLAWATGRKLLLVSILVNASDEPGADPNDEVEAGCVLLPPLPGHLDLSESRHRALAEREVMIALAGGLAEARFRGRRRRKHLSPGDLNGLVYAGAHAGREGLEPYLDRLAARTAVLLDLYWGHVEALADALFLVGPREVTGEQVAAILRGVEAPSDGSSSGREGPADGYGSTRRLRMVATRTNSPVG